MRETTEPTTDERGYESHPSYGMISVHRPQGGGTHLFDSDIEHRNFITMTIHTADRQRHLKSDWIYPRKEIIEVAMSEAQWASVVSSVGGRAVPVTIFHRDGKLVPSAPHRSSLEQSAQEVADAAREAIAHVQEVFEEVEKKPNKGNIKSLRHAIENLPANLKFAGDMLTEHTENVVAKAKFDIEAMAAEAQTVLGAGDVITPRLTEGTEEP